MKKNSTSIRLLLSLILPLSGLVTAPAQTLRFGVIGDFGSGASSERDVANLVKSWSPDLIITVGDNNYPDGAASTIDANIGQFYHSFIYPYTGSYGAGASENRFFPSLGNHDWIASGAAPYLNYFSLPNNERYYDFVRGTVHFFAIDSDSHEPSGTSSTSTQGNWLKNKLASSTAKWKIVYFHHAPYSSGEHGSTTGMQWPFQQWGATAVLSGHDHAYERVLINGFPYFVNGLGGESRYSFGTPIPGSVMRYNSDYGAMLVQANGTNSIQFQFYNRGGTLIDTYTIQSTQTPPSLALATSLASESGPVNGVIDPGERVTVNFTLSNSGGPTTNLVGTLLASSGITSPSSAQTYGAIATGASVTKPFTFTASGVIGATITAMLQLKNGTANLGTVSNSFVLGPNNNPANTSPITIPDVGAGSIYPSKISVAGLPTNPSKVTVTLNGLNHTYPDDVDILLVGPGGQKVLLLSDVGGNVAMSNTTLTFDDAAASTLSDGSAIVSGSYKPTDFATGDTFPGPAPTGPYGTTLSAFNGLNPNGNWSLYVQDDEAGDAGSLAAGWSLKFTFASPSNPSIALTSPTGGATFAAPATVNLAASVSPNGHTITKVQFYNGATLLGEDTSSPYSYTWSSVGAGSYSLTARLVYDAGSTLNSAAANVTVTNSLPTIALTSPVTATSYTAPATVNLAASVSPNGHTITKVQFYNGATLLGEDTSSPYSYTWSSVGAGSYSLTARLVYDAGSTLNSAAANVAVTNSLPTIALTSPVTGTSYAAPATVNLAASVSPNGHTITKVQFYNGATLVGEDTSSPYSYTWSSVGAGSYSLTARLVYDAGSTLNSAAANVTVTNSLPTIALTSPVTGTSYAAPATVNLAASVSPNGHTITKVQFYNGATLLGEDTSSPYSYTWSSVGAGSYSLTARLVYDAGSTLNSAAANVAVTNSLPTIALTSPVTGTSYTAPATVNLAASVSPNGHTITKVQFYNGATLLGEDTSSPYSYTWSSVGAGSYSLTARLVYDAGSTLNSAAANVTVTNSLPPGGLTFEATSGAITAPFVASGGTVYQTTQTTLANSGRAAYSFAIVNAGDYVVTANVNAPNDSANSFFVNIDAEPTDPYMVWQIPVTIGLQSRTVSWQGNGTWDNSQFVPKVFTLTPGTHQLIVRGREGNTRLGTITISPVTISTPPSVALSAPINGTSFSAPATINLAASVTPNGHTITKVQFYNGATLVGEDTSSPYSYTWSSVGAGNYSLTARLVYDAGSTLNSAAANVTVTNSLPPGGLTFEATSGAITAPFVASGGTVSQTTYTTLANSGRAAYSFAIVNAGDYVVTANVDAPNESANSFFVNIDAEPTDPYMVWQIPVTIGLQSRTVSWQGNGTWDNSQFVPKVFTLTAGTHQLIVRGREGNTRLGTITISPVTMGTPPSVALSAPINGTSFSAPANVAVMNPPPGTALPAPWQTADIGTEGLAGNANESNGLYTVQAAGNISGASDNFRFAYQTLSGDGEIKARLPMIQNTGSNARIGVMIRESLTGGSKYAFLGVDGAGAFHWQRRSSTGGSPSSATSGTGIAPNLWVRVVRSGSTLTGYKSTDGVNWTNVNSGSVSMGTTISIGLAVASGSSTTLNTSMFDNVTVVP